MILETIIPKKAQAENEHGDEVARQANAILSRPEIRFLPDYGKETINEIIEVVLKEAKKNKGKLGLGLNGKEKSSKTSVTVVDCETIINDQDQANTLRNKFLFELLEKFSKNQTLSGLLNLSDQIAASDLLLRVIEFLQKLKEKNKVDQQILLVKNFNLLKKDDRNSISKLLFGELSNSSTCRVVVFG